MNKKLRSLLKQDGFDVTIKPQAGVFHTKYPNYIKMDIHCENASMRNRVIFEFYVGEIRHVARLIPQSVNDLSVYRMDTSSPISEIRSEYISKGFVLTKLVIYDARQHNYFHNQVGY